jgi:hypothetical protein
MNHTPRPNRLLQILLLHSARDLFKYKSFFLLIFVLALFDRLLKKIIPVDRSFIRVSELKQLTRESAGYVFERLPQDIWQLLTDYRTFLILAALFLLKQLISLWPSSDMRRMHRSERGAFGLVGSLAVIRWEQVVWDAMAVGTICGLYAVWTGVGFLITHALWQATHAMVLLPILIVYVALFSPMGMAGFSFSSKLAVISKGSFNEKLRLYFQLFVSKQVLWPSWIFFCLRILLELIFVVILPLIILFVVDIIWVRVPLATLIATPVYSYLKMASFKFFLHVYGAYPLVRQEFRQYYGNEEEGPRGQGG